MAGHFALDLSRFAEKAKGNMDLVVRKVCLGIFARVVMKTPVDTGRARGAWALGINQMPESGDNGRFDKGGGNVIGDISSGVSKVSAGSIVYLTNMVPYILRLENGYSKQAPSGMVSLTLRETPGVVETAASEVRK